MFDGLTISGWSDLGVVLESSIYYREVKLVADSGHVVTLIQQMGLENLFRCIDLGVIRILFEHEIPVIHTNSRPFNHYDFGTIEMGRHESEITKGVKTILTPSENLERALLRAFGSEEAKKWSQRVIDSVDFRRIPASVPDAARWHVKQPEYLSKVLKTIIRIIAPCYRNLDKLHANTTMLGDKLVVPTNLDLGMLNKVANRAVLGHSDPLTIAHILSYILDAIKDLVMSANLSTDISVSPISEAIGQAHISNLLGRYARTSSDIAYFQNVVFQGRNFRSAVNSGERTISEFVTLLEDENTHRFKKWLVDRPPEAQLLIEYNDSLAGRHEWLHTIPAKLVKATVFSALVELATSGSWLATVAAVALEGADALLISKLKLGWRPNQFVNGPASTFLRPDD